MTSTMQKLRNYKQIPATGLAIFSGLVSVPGSDKMKRICIDLVPLKPIKHAMYHCDNRFHTEQLQEQLKELVACSGSNGQQATAQRQVGFVIVTGEGTLYGLLNGTNKEVLYKFKVELPKKHGRGGQSQKRFERLSKIARADYVKQAAEQMNKVFISPQTMQPIISNIIYAGPANLKQVLADSEHVDYRLRKLPNSLVDVAYGFELGFHYAIELSSATIQDLRFVKESMIIQGFMQQVVKDNSKVVYGINQTMAAVDLGLAERLIVTEDLNILRVTYKEQDEEKCIFVTPEQFNKMLEKQSSKKSGGSQVEYEHQLLLEWLTDHYQEKNIQLEIISDATPEAKQFEKGFGGLAGTLRFEMDSEVLENCDSATSAFEVNEDADLAEYL